MTSKDLRRLARECQQRWLDDHDLRIGALSLALSDLYPGTGAVTRVWQTWRGKFTVPEFSIAGSDGRKPEKHVTSVLNEADIKDRMSERLVRHQ